MRERETETDRERQRQTDRQRRREAETERERERLGRERQRQRQRDRDSGERERIYVSCYSKPSLWNSSCIHECANHFVLIFVRNFVLVMSKASCWVPFSVSASGVCIPSSCLFTC